MTATEARPRWRRTRPGMYECDRRGAKLEVEYVGPDVSDRHRPVWICRKDGLAFDAAATCREAKALCLMRMEVSE